MHCQLQSPERKLFDGEVKMVVARSPEGEFAVMEGHAPLMAALGPSPLRIKTDSEEKTYALSGGVLQVSADAVTILAHEAIPADAIDIEAVNKRREELSGAQSPDAAGSTGQEIAYLDVLSKLGEKHE